MYIWKVDNLIYSLQPTSFTDRDQLSLHFEFRNVSFFAGEWKHVKLVLLFVDQHNFQTVTSPNIRQVYLPCICAFATNTITVSVYNNGSSKNSLCHNHPAPREISETCVTVFYRVQVTWAFQESVVNDPIGWSIVCGLNLFIVERVWSAALTNIWTVGSRDHHHNLLHFVNEI